jgi:hypothetical protein
MPLAISLTFVSMDVSIVIGRAAAGSGCARSAWWTSM